MGLLERALNYKQKLNDRGKETLIDTIKGPAESPLNHNSINKVNIDEIDDAVPGKTKDDNPEMQPENFPGEIKILDEPVETLPVNHEKDHDEEVILFDEHVSGLDADNGTIIIDDLIDEEKHL